MRFVLIWQNMKAKVRTENEVRRGVALNFAGCD